jgi:molecular chaperone DnaK (HSP70)
MITSTEKMLDENSEKASEEEKTAINSAKDELKKVLENEDSDIEASLAFRRLISTT